MINDILIYAREAATRSKNKRGKPNTDTVLVGESLFVLFNFKLNITHTHHKY